MVALSVCVELFWPNLPMEERIRALKPLGVSACEFWRWDNKDLDKVREAIQETGLKLAALSVAPNRNLVDRDDGRPAIAGVCRSSQIARSFDCQHLIATTGQLLADESFEVTRRRVVRKLREMARVAEDAGVTLVLEPLNPLVDHPGYWLNKLSDAADICEDVGSPSLKILCDLYHQQITEGNLISNLRAYQQWIGHIHAAGVPGRHELAGGELDYGNLFSTLDQLGYAGYVGLELKPAVSEEFAIRQAQQLAQAAVQQEKTEK